PIRRFVHPVRRGAARAVLVFPAREPRAYAFERRVFQTIGVRPRWSELIHCLVAAAPPVLSGRKRQRLGVPSARKLKILRRRAPDRLPGRAVNIPEPSKATSSADVLVVLTVQGIQ